MARQCSPRQIDHVVASFAERQHGVVARRQLLDVGVGPGAIDSRVQRGRLHVVHRGVYAVGYPDLSTRGRWSAAVLACGAAAVLSHRSAGQAWGVLAPRSGLIEVTRPTTFRGRSGLRVHRSVIPEDERSAVAGTPVTSPSRTLFDLASVLSPGQLENAWKEAEVRRLTDRLSVPELLRRYPGRRGVAALRRLMADVTVDKGVTRNDFEARFAALVASSDLPTPRFNAALAVRGRFFEVDCLWPAQRLVVELDGRAVHGTSASFEQDRERDRLLLSEGWRVVRVTWRQLRDDAPAVLGDLRSLLRREVERPTLQG